MVSRYHRQLLKGARRLGLYNSSLGTAPLAQANRYRSMRVAPAVRRHAAANRQASIVNRNPYALLGQRLLMKRRSR